VPPFATETIPDNCVASIDELLIAEATNEVFANWVELFPGAAVGAVGVPVKEGEAIVALNKIFAVLVDILAVFDAIEFVLLVILDVFDAIALVLLVMLAVFAAIKVGSVAMVDELTPPTLFTVVVKFQIPHP
jgi:hypothetical protein